MGCVKKEIHGTDYEWMIYPVWGLVQTILFECLCCSGWYVDQEQPKANKLYQLEVPVTRHSTAKKTKHTGPWFGLHDKDAVGVSDPDSHSAVQQVCDLSGV